MSHHTTLLVIVGYQTVLVLLLRRSFWPLIEAQKQHGGGAFQFTIGDCWIASIGLLPSIFVLAIFLHSIDINGYVDLNWLIITLLAFSGQLAGMMIAVASNMAPSRKAAKDYGAYVMLLFWGAAGLLLPFLGPALLMINYFDRRARAIPPRKKARPAKPRPPSQAA